MNLSFAVESIESLVCHLQKSCHQHIGFAQLCSRRALPANPSQFLVRPLNVAIPFHLYDTDDLRGVIVNVHEQCRMAFADKKRAGSHTNRIFDELCILQRPILVDQVCGQLFR